MTRPVAHPTQKKVHGHMGTFCYYAGSKTIGYTTHVHRPSCQDAHAFSVGTRYALAWDVETATRVKVLLLSGTPWGVV